MRAVTDAALPETWLDARAAERLRRRLRATVRRPGSALSRGLVSVTSVVDGSVDPSAVVAAARRPDEPWFCFEQPDRDGAAVAALGRVRAREGGGAGRLAPGAARGRPA